MNPGNPRHKTVAVVVGFATAVVAIAVPCLSLFVVVCWSLIIWSLVYLLDIGYLVVVLVWVVSWPVCLLVCLFGWLVWLGRAWGFGWLVGAAAASAAAAGAAAGAAAAAGGGAAAAAAAAAAVRGGGGLVVCWFIVRLCFRL